MLQGLSNQAEHPLAERMLQLPSCANYTFTPGSIRSFQSDLCWWDIFLNSWNGLSLFQCTTIQTIVTHDFSIQTNASGSWGCGAFSQGKWLQIEWPPQWPTVHIMSKELLPIFLSCVVWSHYWLDTKYYSSVITVLW